MPAVKREYSSTPNSDSDASPPPSKTPKSNKKKKDSSSIDQEPNFTPTIPSPKKLKVTKESKSPNPNKARISATAKQAIAEAIIQVGASGLNVDELERITGLTRTQIKSQICDNRQNLRKQLIEVARSLQ